MESDEQIREKEVGALLDIFMSHRNMTRPHILCGDFNSNSPVQQIDPEKCKPSTKKAWNANGGLVPRRAIQKLLENGYVDSLHAVHPEQAKTQGTFSTQFPGQRVDYIFTHSIGRERLKEASIEDDRLAKYASDHFPVMAELI
jgi:exonuclease III